MKRVGICIKEFDSIFTNGCAQQGYFVMKSLRKAGYEVDFVSIESQLKEFEVIKEPVYNICDLDILQKYSVLIFSSLIVDQYILLNQIKLLGIKIANLMVGNFYIINCEEFVFNVHDNVIKDMNNEYVDEIWLMPMYTHVKEYIEGMTKKPVQIIPYVWDSEIIDEYVKLKSIKPKYLQLQNDNPIDIILMEPNLSIHKTALPILVMLNKYFINRPSRLGTIHLFGKPKRNKDCLKCIKHLEIVQCEKVALYDRTLSLEIFHRLRSSNIKYVMISNNIRNGLNFIHLECLTLGIPVIHNCKPYEMNGLFYEDSDCNTEYNKALEYLDKVWEGTITNNIEGSKKILEKYNPYNSSNGNNYSELITKLNNKAKPSIYDLNNIFTKSNTNYKIIDKFIIVIAINNLCNIEVLKINLLTIDNNTNKKYKMNLYIETAMFNKIEKVILENKYKNLDIKLHNVNVAQSGTARVSLHALANSRELYIFYINQNTILYIPVHEIERIILKNKAFVGVPQTLELSEENIKKTLNYIESIFKSFGRINSAKLIDTNFFAYRNTSSIIHYLNKSINTDYNLISTFLSEEYLLSLFFTLILDKMVIIDIKTQLATNMVNKNEYYPFGYIVNSDNSCLFVNIDTNCNKNVDLQNIIPVNFKESIKTIVNNHIYRTIKYE